MARVTVSSTAEIKYSASECDGEYDFYPEQQQTGYLLDHQNDFLTFEPKVTITFALNSGERYTASFNHTTSFAAVKEELSSTFQVPSRVLSIYREDTEILDFQTPCDLGANPFDCLELRIVSRESNRWPLRSKRLVLPAPDILTVLVDDDREIVVEVEDRTIRKPFLGGYKNPDTGIEYHHATSQATPIIPKKERYTRDTQTAATKHKSTETPCNVASQTGEDSYQYQSIRVAGNFLPAQPQLSRYTIEEENAAKCIQRNFRAFRCRRHFFSFIKSKKEEMQRDQVKAKAREIQDDKRMTYPRSKADFDMLYAMVERWRRAQTDRIAQLKTDAPRKAELCTVLEKEIKLLESIEAHRIRMIKEQKNERKKRFLQQVTEPITWTGYRGLKISMDTIRTQRARELASIYNELSEEVPSSVRVERLMALKHAIASEKSSNVSQLIELIDREAELLTRGAPEKTLEYLRARIQQMFYRYFQESEPQKPSKERYIFCRQCRRMRARKSFNIASRDTDVTVCGTCRLTKCEAHNYRYILRAVRKDEQRRNCYSSCAFIMTEEDMEFLVISIWHGRSVVSAVDDLRILRLPRWDVTQDWTPWNCILLTERETRAHLQVPINSQYGEHLLHYIAAKHELAKRHFAQIIAVDARLRDSGVWANVTQDD